MNMNTHRDHNLQQDSSKNEYASTEISNKTCFLSTMEELDSTIVDFNKALL